MSEQADALERDDEELELEPVDEGQDEEQPEGDADDGSEGDGEAAEDDELEISFGDEAAPASRGEDSELVKTLRKQLREKSNQLAALGRAPAQPQIIEVGEKPTIEGCDYDDAKFEAEYEAWQQRKAQAATQEAEVQTQVQAAGAALAEKVSKFQSGKVALGAKDFEAVKDVTISALNDAQMIVVLKAADNPAALTYALGRHPQKLAALADTHDLVEFTAALVRMESTLKMTSKRTRTPPEPDTPARGSAPLSANGDKHLERLEQKAARTGDRTEVVAYKRQLKAKATGKSK